MFQSILEINYTLQHLGQGHRLSKIKQHFSGHENANIPIKLNINGI